MKQSKNQKTENKDTAELQSKCDEYLAGWKRSQADYQNLQQENEKRIKEIHSFSAMRIITELLPILDHYEMAMNHVPQAVEKEQWMQGFYFIKKQFNEFLENQGLKKIETIGTQFDPHVHEAIAEEASDKKENEIIKESQAGYMLKDMVIRHAKVVVSSHQAIKS